MTIRPQDRKRWRGQPSEHLIALSRAIGALDDNEYNFVRAQLLMERFLEETSGTLESIAGDFGSTPGTWEHVHRVMRNALAGQTLETARETFWRYIHDLTRNHRLGPMIASARLAEKWASLKGTHNNG